MVSLGAGEVLGGHSEGQPRGGNIGNTRGRLAGAAAGRSLTPSWARDAQRLGPVCGH